MKNYNEDTICALSTAPYRAAIGVIRVSGHDALDTVNRIFSKNVYSAPQSSAIHGFILDGGAAIDDVLVTVFHAPHSYTGEDIAEISCHGGMTVIRRILALLIANGARQAEGGEFTKRAFLNGKLDLAQAEAVIDLIDSESENEAKAAASQLSGHLSRRIDAMREQLVSVSAQILAFIDYPDDEIADVSPETLGAEIRDVYKKVCAAKNTFSTGKMIKDGIKTVIVGKPNVGKSCLMNQILGYDRSIVTDIAGTTRDIVEEKTEFAGLKLVVSDTAGIHATDDTVEKIGVQLAREKLEKADLILAVFDISRDKNDDDTRIIFDLKCVDAKKIAVFNKSDLSDAKGFDTEGFDNVVYVSAKTGDGMGALENAIKELFADGGELKTDGTVTNLRQYECLCRAQEELRHALDNIIMTSDAILSDVERAIDALGTITGKTVSEQITQNIFSRFCVGK